MKTITSPRPTAISHAARPHKKRCLPEVVTAPLFLAITIEFLAGQGLEPASDRRVQPLLYLWVGVKVLDSFDARKVRGGVFKNLLESTKPATPRHPAPRNRASLICVCRARGIHHGMHRDAEQKHCLVCCASVHIVHGACHLGQNK